MVWKAMVNNMSDLTLFHDQTTNLDYAGDIGETTPVSWQPRGTLNYEEWIAIGNTLQQVGASLNWWIGDWLNYGERKWGEMYAQAVEVTGWEYQTLRNAKWVTGRIHMSLRRDNLSWSHHKEIANLEPDEQAAWLNRAAIGGWSVRQLREEIRGLQETIPPLSLSLSETDEAPFNHHTRNGIPASERTAVDEYEQQDEEWIDDGVEVINVTDQFGHTETFSVPSNLGVHFSSDTPEHYTPSEIIDSVIACMGRIDLDPCSNSKTDPSIPATIHYTKKDDGLAQEWRGNVYMNPPYGREIGAWVEKLCSEHSAGNVTEAIALVPARTDTQWFIKLRDYPVCFVEGRLTFVGNNDPAPFPSAIFYLGKNIDAFYHAFCGLGDIWQRIEPGMFGG